MTDVEADDLFTVETGNNVSRSTSLQQSQFEDSGLIPLAELAKMQFEPAKRKGSMTSVQQHAATLEDKRLVSRSQRIDSRVSIAVPPAATQRSSPSSRVSSASRRSPQRHSSGINNSFGAQSDPLHVGKNDDSMYARNRPLISNPRPVVLCCRSAADVLLRRPSAPFCTKSQSSSCETSKPPSPIEFYEE
jgi:hypothetical protein